MGCREVPKVGRERERERKEKKKRERNSVKNLLEMETRLQQIFQTENYYSFRVTSFLLPG